MPTLDVRCGPMLRYDTVVDSVWHGFALLVTSDPTSDVSEAAPPLLRLSTANSKGPAVQAGPEAVLQETAEKSITAVKIHAYTGQGPAASFWRFKLEIPMSDFEQAITYSIEGTPHPNTDTPAALDVGAHTFYVPAKTQTFRWAAHSCNGFSSSEDPNLWAPPDSKEEAPFNGANPLWDDLLNHHKENVFHALVGGGDQMYADKLMNEPELKLWHEEKDSKKRMAIPLTDEIEVCLERFYFNAYCNWFGKGTFSKAIAQIPMINMLDDHDLIDGFGTYTDELMMAPVFNAIGRYGFKYYYLFQQFLSPLGCDGVDERNHPCKSVIIAGKAAYVQIPHHSFLTYLGPKQWILLVDCRAERKVAQICSEDSYDKLFSKIRALPAGVEHLTVLLGVPLAYPRMVFLERTLSSSFNPLVMLAKGLAPGFTNKFDGQVELLDDLGDHWTAAPHKKERNWLVERVQELALEKYLRISYLSGDVHASGVGVFYGYHAHQPALDPKYALAIITSAIVNAPPPAPVISMLNKLAAKKHRSLYYCGTKESMVPLFSENLDGKKQNDAYIMGARNWAAVDYVVDSGELQFDIRVEKSKGTGAQGTKSYPVRTPKPAWNIPKEHHHHLHGAQWREVMEKFTGHKGHSRDDSSASASKVSST